MTRRMTTEAKPPKTALLAALCLAAIAGAGLWIYRTEFAGPQFNRTLHQAVGRVLAEETATLLGHTGKVVIIAIELADLPELKVQLEEFSRTLKRFPQIKIKETYRLETDDKPKYSFGTGLSARRFVRIVNKNTTADAIVSFVGAPALSPEHLAQLKTSPKFIAESRSADKLKKLFEQKVIQAAVVSRFEFPTPVKGAPRSPREWFDQRFQVVTASNAVRLPDGKED